MKLTGSRPVRFHDLRHGAISNQLNAGGDVFAASEMAGDATAAFTMTVYGHLARERAAQVAAAGAAYVPWKGAGG